VFYTFPRGWCGCILPEQLNSDGIFSSVTESLNNQIKGIDEDRDALARKMRNYETRLRKQFTALDVLI
jgi:flagellar hook-associated protein 2